MEKQLFYIAVLVSEPLAGEIKDIKNVFAERFHSNRALRSPAHITLQPPFYESSENLETLKSQLTDLSQGTIAFKIQLLNFNNFGKKVIYIDVKPSVELSALRNNLLNRLKTFFHYEFDLESPFHPHITVAFRDLTSQNFLSAWPEYQHKSFEHSFTADNLTLLKHAGKYWEVFQSFPFNTSL